MAKNATTSLSTWNFHTFHVQSELEGGQFVSAESTLLASGPPDITSNINQSATQGMDNSSLVDQQVYPIGVMENAGLSQSKQLQRIFEIGSARSYFIPGRVVGSMNWGRVFYHGVTLLRALYAYYTSTKFSINPAQLHIKYAPNAGQAPPELKVNPGFDNFWMSLYSDVFNQPTGNLLYFRDMTNRDVGALYLEYLYVQGHQLSISSGSVLLMEGGSGQFDRVVPARMKLSV